MVTPFLDGETLEENEALAIDEVRTQFDETLGEVRKGEVALYRISPMYHSMYDNPQTPP